MVVWQHVVVEIVDDVDDDVESVAVQVVDVLGVESVVVLVSRVACCSARNEVRWGTRFVNRKSQAKSHLSALNCSHFFKFFVLCFLPASSHEQ